MVKTMVPKNKKVVMEEKETDFIPVGKRGKKISPEYDNGIQKIASYSGVTRTMRFKDKSGKFDEIVNIYVYPDGIVTDYDDKIIDKYIGENAISKQNVRNHGNKSKTIWGKREDEAGYVPPASRNKKHSKPMKRVTILHKRK
jgi:hypothetical protein